MKNLAKLVQPLVITALALVVGVQLGHSAETVGVTGAVVHAYTTTLVADDGAGTKPAATITPSGVDLVYCECNDATGCTITMGETGMKDGATVTIVSTGTGNCEFADSAGVSELAGAFVAGVNDVLVLVYKVATFVEAGRSNN